MAESHKEIVKSLNEIIRLLEKKSKNNTLRSEEMRRALRSSCSAITSIISDEELLSQLAASKTEYIELIENRDVFETRFLSAENSALNKAGINSIAKKSIIRQARNQRTEISFSSDYRSEVLKQLNKTNSILNNMLEKLENDGATLEGKKHAQSNWRRISYLVSGAALIAVDAALGITQPPLAPIAAISSMFGKKIIEDNLHRWS